VFGGGTAGMSAILFASNHEVLTPYAHYFAAAIYIAFKSP
jgi:hypothetical protein